MQSKNFWHLIRLIRVQVLPTKVLFICASIVATKNIYGCKRNTTFQSNSEIKETKKDDIQPQSTTPPSVEIQTAKSCNISNTSITTVQKRPLDVFFSIDVSTSMTFVLQSVKSGVIQFAENLSTKGFDVRFAASGFVDKPTDYFIAYTTASTFQTNISNWNVRNDGNIDVQEGGQENLELALKTMQETGRAGAVHVLVHISDALAFVPGNHENFDTSALAQKFSEAQPALNNFMFFDSVPSDNDFLGYVFTFTDASRHNPASQMNEFRQKAGNLAGSPLDFPFSAQTLTSDKLPQLIFSNTTIADECDQ